jgi:hypothetical protein
VKKLIVVFSLVAMLVAQQRAYAFVPPASPLFTGTLNTEIASAISANLARSGLVVGGSTLASTMSGVGGAAEAAAAVGAGVMAIGTLPVWGAVAIGVGVIAALGGVALGTYRLIENTAGSGLTQDGSPVPVSLTLQLQSQQSSGGGGPSGSYYVMPTCSSSCPQGLSVLPATMPYYAPWTLDSPAVQNAVLGGNSGLEMANQEAAAYSRYWCAQSTLFVNCSSSVVAAGTSQSVEPLPYTLTVTYNYSFEVGASGVGGGPHTTTLSSLAVRNPAYINPNLTGTLTTLAPQISTEMLAQPLPASLVAAIANKLWQDAQAVPGYQGAPYRATSPVTEADVQTATQTATFNDLLNSSPSPLGTSAIPFSPTGSYTPTGTGTGNGSGSDGTSNLCQDDPTAVACATLGDAPAAPPIPTSSVQVALTEGSVGPDDAACPAALEVTVFGTVQHFEFTPMCTVARGLRPVVLVVCALIAAFIVAGGISL